jgi:hypothetical protein
MSFNPLSFAKQVFQRDVAQPVHNFFAQPPTPQRPLTYHGQVIPQPNAAGAVPGGPMNLNTQTLGLNKSGFIPREVRYSPEQMRQAQPAINQTVKQLALTPQFANLLQNSHPAVTPPTPGAGGDFSSRIFGMNQIRVSPQAMAQPNFIQAELLRHEALHNAWDSMPNQRTKFIKAYNSSATPDLKAYLAARLSNPLYPGQHNVNNLSFVDDGTTQTEIHSYIPEFYTSNNIPMPPALQAYYSQFFNPNRANSNIQKEIALLMQRHQMANKILSSLGELPPPDPSGDY